MFFSTFILKQVYIFQILKEMKHKNATGKLELEPTLYVQFSVSLCFISLLRDKLPQITRVPWFY